MANIEIDDEKDWRAAAFTRQLVLGNPNLTYNAEDSDCTPTNRRRFVELMAGRFSGLIVDALVKNVRTRYRSLDELPTRYGIAFCFAYYLRRCNKSETRQFCPEFYFYSFDDLYKFLDLYRGRGKSIEPMVDQGLFLEVSAETKGFGNLVKHICTSFFVGNQDGRFETRRPFEEEWKRKLERRPPGSLLIDMCSNTFIHGWKHADVVKLCHMSSKPWDHNGELSALVAWKGAQNAVEVIDEYRFEHPDLFSTNRSMTKLVDDLLRAIAFIKSSNDPKAIAETLMKHPEELCREILPGGIVPRRHYVHTEITSIFARYTPLRQLLRCLPSWQARGFFNSEALTIISKRLKSAECIEKEGLTPAEIIMAKMNYARFKEQLEKRAEPPLPQSMASLDINAAAAAKISRKRKRAEACAGIGYEPNSDILKSFVYAYNHSLENVKPIYGDAKLVVAIDTRVCVDERIRGAPSFKAVEAVSCLISMACNVQVRPPVIIIDEKGDKQVNVNRMDCPTDQFTAIVENLQKVSQHASSGFSYASPLKKAASTKSNFFIIVTNRPKNRIAWFDEIKNALVDYKRKEKVMAKIAICFLLRRRDEVQPLPVSDDILVVNGWNRHVPEVIWSFARGELDEVQINCPETA